MIIKRLSCFETWFNLIIHNHVHFTSNATNKNKLSLHGKNLLDTCLMTVLQTAFLSELVSPNPGLNAVVWLVRFLTGPLQSQDSNRPPVFLLQKLATPWFRAMYREITKWMREKYWKALYSKATKYKKHD